MTTTINASPTNGIVQTADGSGVMKLQSNGVTTNALAWVNFAGSSGTRNASYNVSSVTRNNTGYYTINFASALSDANYTPVISGSTNNSSTSGLSIMLYCDQVATSTITSPTTSSFTLSVATGVSGARYDSNYVNVVVFGN